MPAIKSQGAAMPAIPRRMAAVCPCKVLVSRAVQSSDLLLKQSRECRAECSALLLFFCKPVFSDFQPVTSPDAFWLCFPNSTFELTPMSDVCGDNNKHALACARCCKKKMKKLQR